MRRALQENRPYGGVVRAGPEVERAGHGLRVNRASGGGMLLRLELSRGSGVEGGGGVAEAAGQLAGNGGAFRSGVGLASLRFTLRARGRSARARGNGRRRRRDA